MTIALSTASPYKFLDDVMDAIGEKTKSDIFKSAKKFHEVTGVDIPEPFLDLEGAVERFDKIINIDEMKNEVENFVNE